MKPPIKIDNVDNFATYFELILGMQQLCSMVELNLMIKFSSLYKVFNRGDGDLVKKKNNIFKKIKICRYLTCFAAVSLIVICTFLTSYLGSRLSHDAQTFILITSTSFFVVSILLLWQLFNILKSASMRFEGEFLKELE